MIYFSKFINNFLLSSLRDVNIISPTEGQVLTYDAASSKWVNR